MIKDVLINIAKEIGYNSKTIEYAKTLTYKTSTLRENNKYGRHIFVASLYISARMKRNEIITVKQLLSTYELSERTLRTYQTKVLNANNISYYGSSQLETKKVHEIHKQHSFFDTFE